MLSKDSFFRLVKYILKSKSMHSFEPFQDSFDHHLRVSANSLKLSSHYGEHNGTSPVSERGIGLGISYTANNDTKTITNDVRSIIPSVVGDDIMKPFEVILSFQLLEFQSCISHNKTNTDADVQKMIDRMNKLIFIATKHIQDFSFVKISLMLNSMANIIKRNQRNFAVAKQVGRTNGTIKNNILIKGCSSRLESLNEDTVDKVDMGFVLDLGTFNSVVTSRLILSLYNNSNNIQEAWMKGNSSEYIDYHSICMILKYYETVQTITISLIYSIYCWLIQQKEIRWMDKLAMLGHVSKFRNKDLFEPCDFNSVGALIANDIDYHNEDELFGIPIARNHYQQMLDDVKDKENYPKSSFIDILVNELLSKVTEGITSIVILRRYIKVIKRLGIKGVLRPIIQRAILDALDEIGSIFALEEKDVIIDIKEYYLFISEVLDCIRDGFGDVNANIHIDKVIYQRNTSSNLTSQDASFGLNQQHFRDLEGFIESIRNILLSIDTSKNNNTHFSPAMNTIPCFLTSVNHSTLV